MDLRRSVPLALAVSALVPACNPYHNRSGDFLAGSVDPVNFASAYQGPGYTKGAAFGRFTPTVANYKNTAIAYYAFPLPSAAVLAAIAPSTNLPTGTMLTASATDPNATFVAPLAYVFDPAAPTSPFPAKQQCVPPTNYVYDERRDGYRLDEQGNIFTLLPDDPNYVAIVSQVTVTSAGERCQDVKTAESVVQRSDVKIPAGLEVLAPGAMFRTGKTDNPTQFLMWAIIDPSARVLLPDAVLGGNRLDPNTRLGPQRWGWFDHFLLAYLDGGYIPTNTHTVPGMMGQPATTVTELVPQIMYVPDTIPNPAGGMPATIPGSLGMGNDIMQFKRGDAGYSPLCHVIFFTPTDPTMLPTSFADVTAATVKTDNNQYIACLQVK